MITIYSTPTCVYCNNLKKYLTEKNVKYEAVDVSLDQKALDKMINISGQMGVPVIDIDGNIIIGFDRPKIDELLNLK